MKFKLGQPLEALKQQRAQWHLWFAWYPVTTIDNQWVWLEHVERRGGYYAVEYGSAWAYEYKT